MVPARVAEILNQLNESPAGTLESKVLEFKSWCNNQKDLSYEIAEAAVCLANAEGGLVIFGVDDKKAGIQALKPCPYPALSVEWIQKVIRDLTKPPVQCNVAKSTDLVPGLQNTPCRDLFIVEVAKTHLPYGHRTNDGVSYIRVDTECRVDYFTNEDDYTKSWLDHANLSYLDEGSIQNAVKKREATFAHLRRSGHRPLDHLLETGLLRWKDGVSVPESDALMPSMAGFLMLGMHDTLHKEISAAGTVLTIETSVTKPLATWDWLNVVESLGSYIPLIAAELARRDTELPQAVIVELLVNAYVHRCYRTAGAIQIRIKEKEIEIQNPGGLLGDLTTESILYSPPIYRNFALADAMRQFGFCEKAGTGIDKVYYTLLAAGLDFPIFQSEGNSFSVIIRTQKDIPFARMIRNHAGELELTVTDLVVMRSLRTRQEAGIEYLAKLAQRPTQYMEGSLRDLQRRKIVELRRGARYRLAEPLLNQIARYDDEAQGKLF